MVKFTIFSWFKEITETKRKWDDIPEEEQKTLNVYIVNRILSMHEPFIELVNMVQDMKGLLPKDVYLIYSTYTPKTKGLWAPFMKPTIKVEEEQVNRISEYFKCSKREVKEFINLIPKGDIEEFLTNFKEPTKKKI